LSLFKTVKLFLDIFSTMIECRLEPRGETK